MVIRQTSEALRTIVAFHPGGFSSQGWQDVSELLESMSLLYVLER